MSILFFARLNASSSIIKSFNNTFRRMTSKLSQLKRATKIYDVLLDTGKDKAQAPSKQGYVILVGAGPGDPELLTIKGLKALGRADVVLFDWLVSKDVLALIPKTTKIEFVGKRAGKHSVAQGEICTRMVELAQQGKCVVRLKGGDPAVFARTAEETDALAEHNIPCTIIPGITAASGASAASGIPLTHRECANSLRFVTATMKSAQEQPHWQNLAQSLSYQTLVFYMGLGRLNMITEQLIANGAAKDTPIALIDNATNPDQIVLQGCLFSIHDKVKKASLAGPALIIVGEVVNKRAKVVDFQDANIASLDAHQEHNYYG